MGILRVSLFGNISVRYDDQAKDLKLTPVVQELLAFLILSSHHPLSRDVLAEQFWGEYSQGRARHCLKTALWRLRRSLEPEGVSNGTYLVTTRRGEIGFNHDSPYWLDVDVFLQQVTPVLSSPSEQGSSTDAHACSTALALYRGDFLEGFYDDWAIHLRERFRILYLDALTWLVHYHKHQCQFEKSLAYARQILEMDPLQEEIHREVMRLYIALGQRPKAFQQFELCQEILKKEMGIGPMEETLQLYQLIVNGQRNLTVSARGQNNDLLARILGQIQSGYQAINDAQERFREAAEMLEGIMHQSK